MSHANATLAVVPAIRSGDADVWRLAIAQALAGANSAVVYATGVIVGNMLAPSPALATLPISIFVGASALVLECHRPEERMRVQSLNDFLLFGTMAVGSFSSGSLLTAYGWDVVLWVSFLPLLIAGVALSWQAGTHSPAPEQGRTSEA